VQVNTAYDMLLMQSMKRRLSGEGVSQKVRFADVARRKPAKQVWAAHQCRICLLGPCMGDECLEASRMPL
jgi:hypothetical protein